MRSLQASEGEVRPGEVVSTRSSGGFLADAVVVVGGGVLSQQFSLARAISWIGP